MGSLSPGQGPNMTITTANLASPAISIHIHDPLGLESPPVESRMTDASPGWQSPIRQHKRTPSAPREVKETLDARSEYMSDDEDGRTHHRVNQYIIKDEIGRGSYGAVHLAVDQYGNEYAIKEFSKARLRKRAQSNILRHGPRRTPSRLSVDGPLSPPLTMHFGLAGQRTAEARDALFLIREEVAIMKKLNHPNLVQLIEVLDDPEEDSLYMVMEMCKKGVVMKVGLEERANPFPEEICRYWFRDLILGIEYLHAQGVIHRDIKPDNLLLSEDEVLKVVDFGVSEMFEKPDDMRTAKSAGSPAFLPPELCVARHGNVSGKAADVWSMGVTLYCLRYGRIPFRQVGVLETYRAIKEDAPEIPDDEGPDFRDLMRRILEKEPNKRITMDALREHAWVTRNDTDPLLSKGENLAEPVEPPNDLELSRAITRKMNHLMCVMKSIHRFKSLLNRSRRSGTPTSLTATDSPLFGPDAEDGKADEIASLVRQRHGFMKGRVAGAAPLPIRTAGADSPLLGIGTGCRPDTRATGNDDGTASDAEANVVAESPTAVDFSVYDRAYEEEVARIRAQQQQQMLPSSGPGPERQQPRNKSTTMYLTRLVGDKSQFLGVGDIVASVLSGTATPLPAGTETAVPVSGEQRARTLEEEHR